jgi:AcrR family transcriptional regulator
VVQAAAALADEAGLDAVTLAELAARLGVRTPSLYNHVAGLPGLRRDLALYGTQALGACLGRAVMGKSGDAALLALADAYRAFIAAHPGLYDATIRPVRPADPPDPELEEAARATVDVALAVLASYGLSGEAALHAVRGVRSVVHGFATLEAAGGFGLPLDIDESFHRLVRMLITALHQDA